MKRDRAEYMRRYYAEHREERSIYYSRYYLEHRAEISYRQECYKAQPRGDAYGWIRDAREQAGVTQTRLAAAAGCSASHISMLESGKADASAAMQERIAHALTLLLAGAKP